MQRDASRVGYRLHSATEKTLHAKMSYTIRAKCVIVGDSTVGKSTLSTAFHSDGIQYAKTYNMVSEF